MLILVAKAFLKEGNKEKFKELATELVEKTRQEPGNVSYRLLEGAENSNMVTFLEEWKDKEAMEYHFNTEHFQRILPLLFELQVEPSTPDIYQIMF